MTFDDDDLRILVIALNSHIFCVECYSENTDCDEYKNLKLRIENFLQMKLRKQMEPNNQPSVEISQDTSNQETIREKFEKFCEENPDSLECRIYED